MGTESSSTLRLVKNDPAPPKPECSKYDAAIQETVKRVEAEQYEAAWFRKYDDIDRADSPVIGVDLFILMRRHPIEVACEYRDSRDYVKIMVEYNGRSKYRHLENDFGEAPLDDPAAAAAEIDRLIASVVKQNRANAK